MAERLRVLIVEDRPSDAELMVRELKRAGFEPEWRRVETEQEFAAALTPELDVVLSDYSMPEFDAPRALEILVQQAVDIPLIIVSGTIGEETAVAAMKLGASDYLIKDRLFRLGSSVRQALEQKRQRLERARMSAALAAVGAKYRDLFDNAPNGIFQTTSEGRILTANRAATQICGYDSPEEMMATVTNLQEQLYVDADRRLEFQRQVREQGVVANFEAEVQRKDGSRTWVSVTARAARDPDGTLRYDGILVDISDRKRAEEALRASHAQLLSFVEHAPTSLAMFDRDMVCLAASQRWIRENGRGRADIVGVCHYDVHPDIPEAGRDIHRRALAGETLGSDEDHWVRDDGSQLWLRWRIQPWRDGAGNIGGIMILTEDVTDRKRADQAVVEWKNRYEAAINAGGQVLYDADLASGQVTWGGSLQKVLGYAAEEMGGGVAQWLQMIHPGDREVFQHEVEHATKTRVPFALEYWVQRKNGSYAFVEDHGHVFRDAGGNATRVVGFLVDITERRRAERRLATQHAVTRVLASSVSMEAVAPEILQAICETKGMEFGAIWEIDRHDNVMRCVDLWRSPDLEAEELEAETRRTTFAHGVGLIGRVWAGNAPLVLQDVTPDAASLRSAAHRAGVIGGFAFPILSRGEVIGVVDCLTRERLDAEPELADLLSAIGSQIGQFIVHRRAEQQLLQAQKMEAVGQLAGGIAHDFNNLLGVMLGYVDLAASELGAAHKTSRRLEAIRKAAKRAADLTRQILTFSRKQTVEARVVDLNGVVAEMETMLRRLIGEDVRLAVVLGDGLGGVRVDPGQVEQVIMNLAVNARDAMPSGGRLVIETSLQELDAAYVRSHPDARPGPHVMLTISDTGEGMSRETLSRIFEPFFTTKALGKGTGLGLAVVYGIVKQSGGSLSVYSEVGRGTTFKIYLPQVEGAESGEESEGPGVVAVGTETILLLEDEEPLRTLFAEVLRMAGYAVREAADPAAAAVVAAQSAHSIDLLITDVVLPGQSGPETARQLRASHPNLRVLMVSGYTDRMLEGDPTIEPNQPFLSKPFTGDELLRKVREVLDRK